MRRSVGILAAATVLLSTAAHAEQGVVRLGAATVRFEAARWKAIAAERSLRLAPRDAAGTLDPVTLSISTAATTCAAQAAGAFALGHYDTAEIASAPAILGGKTAERFTAHTRCRNATPRGEVICVKVAEATYLLQAVQPGCGGRNLFSGIDPLDEIARGVTFAPPSAP